jgi:hypothetical protein
LLLLLAIHIETRTIAAVSAESFNNVFTSDYDDYRILFNKLNSASNVTLGLRLRLSGTDNSTNYLWAYSLSSVAPAFLGISGSSDTSLRITNILASAGTDTAQASLDITSPNLAKRTLITGTIQGVFSGVSGFGGGGGVHLTATAYDGFSLIGSASFSGEVSIYGYRK